MRNASLEELSDDFNLLTHINDSEHLGLHFVTKEVSDFCDIGPEEVKALGSDFIANHIHPSDIPRIVTGLQRLQQESKTNSDAYFCFLQRAKGIRKTYSLLLTTTVYMKDTGHFLSVSTDALKLDTLFSKLSGLNDDITYTQQHLREYFSLSLREKEVIAHVAMGLTNKVIAERLLISEETVKQHKKNIRSKTGLGSLAEWERFANAFDIGVNH